MCQDRQCSGGDSHVKLDVQLRDLKHGSPGAGIRNCAATVTVGTCIGQQHDYIEFQRNSVLVEFRAQCGTAAQGKSRCHSASAQSRSPGGVKLRSAVSVDIYGQDLV